MNKILIIFSKNEKLKELLSRANKKLRHIITNPAGIKHVTNSKDCQRQIFIMIYFT